MKFLFITLLLFFNINCAFAEHSHTHKEPINKTKPLKADFLVNKNEVLVDVHGVVCSFCAYGIQKKLSKLNFIDSSKFNKGIFLDTEKQKLTIAIKSDQNPDLVQIYKQVKAAGYEPIAIYTNPNGENVIKHKVEDIK